MDFKLNEEQQAIQEAASAFAKTELLPEVIERDIKCEFPKTLVTKMADMGFMGMMVPPAYGGGGMDTLSYVIVLEEIAKIDASAAVIMSVNNSLLCSVRTGSRLRRHLSKNHSRRQRRPLPTEWNKKLDHEWSFSRLLSGDCTDR